MRFLDFLLCLGLFVLAIFIFRLDLLDFRELQKQETKSSTSFDSPVPFRFVHGYDEHGQIISKLPLERQNLAIFVIHGSSFATEAALWTSIVAHNNSTELGFVGVCDDQVCIDRLSQARGTLLFSSLIYGDYLAMRTLIKTDHDGQIEILNRATGAVKTFPRPQTLEDFAGIKGHMAEVR